jgi:hypothetical protein
MGKPEMLASLDAARKRGEDEEIQKIKDGPENKARARVAKLWG